MIKIANSVFAQANHERVYSSGLSQLKPSCINPVPAVVFLRMLKMRCFSFLLSVVSASIISEMCQIKFSGV